MLKTLCLCVALTMMVSCSRSTKNEVRTEAQSSETTFTNKSQIQTNETKTFSLQVTNLASGQRMYVLGNGFLVSETTTNSFSELWAVDLLDRHPNIRKAMEDVRGLPMADTVTEDDARSVWELLKALPDLDGFVPLEFGGTIEKHRRFLIIILPGKIERTRYNLCLIRIASGKWMFVELKPML